MLRLKFDYVYGMDSTQDEACPCSAVAAPSRRPHSALAAPSRRPHSAPTAQVFEDLAHPMIEAILNSYNGTMFAYGQTGSGRCRVAGVHAA